MANSSNWYIFKFWIYKYRYLNALRKSLFYYWQHFLLAASQGKPRSRVKTASGDSAAFWCNGETHSIPVAAKKTGEDVKSKVSTWAFESALMLRYNRWFMNDNQVQKIDCSLNTLILTQRWISSKVTCWFTCVLVNILCFLLALHVSVENLIPGTWSCPYFVIASIYLEISVFDDRLIVSTQRLLWS